MSLWYYEDYIPHYQLGLEIKETLYQGNSRFQKIQVIDSFLYGKVLLLDDIVQTTEQDEFMYHEMLIHPAMVTHPKPKKVLIVGGGDGGAAREILKHPVEKVKLVDIDAAVIEISRKYFPQLGNWNEKAGSFRGRRSEIFSDYQRTVRRNGHGFNRSVPIWCR